MRRGRSRLSRLGFALPFTRRFLHRQFRLHQTGLAQQFDPGFDAASIETRPSKAGNYLGLTITITATSREQLDELYRTLSTHPMVKVVL